MRSKSILNVTCTHCGNPFHAAPARLAKGAFTCSQACRNASTPKPKTIEIACAYCGITFTDHESQRRKYCCNEHKALSRRKRRVLICRGCGVEYEKAVSVASAYHSPQCRKEHQAKLQIEYSERLEIARLRNIEEAENVIQCTPQLPPDIDIDSYLLGVFDGEGCISGGMDKRDKRWFLGATVALASEPICRLFQSRWGGGCTSRSQPTTGGLILWQWQLSGGRAAEFLEIVARCCLVKQEQARLGLSLAQNMAKYSEPGYRVGVALSSGERMITPEDHILRESCVRQLRSLNGARSRFEDQITVLPSPEIDDVIDDHEA